MSSEQNNPTVDDPRSAMTIIVGLIGAIWILAVVLLAQVLFYNVQRVEDETKLYAARPRELADLQAQQLSRINETRWVDQAKGVVAIPIDQAIERYVTEMKSGGTATTIPATGAPTAPPVRDSHR